MPWSLLKLAAFLPLEALGTMIRRPGRGGQRRVPKDDKPSQKCLGKITQQARSRTALSSHMSFPRIRERSNEPEVDSDYSRYLGTPYPRRTYYLGEPVRCENNSATIRTRDAPTGEQSEEKSCQVFEDIWLPPRDSNPDMLIQSQLSYH